MQGAASEVVTLISPKIFPPASKRIPGLPGAARVASVCQKPLHGLSIRQFASASALFKSYHMRNSIDDIYDMGGMVGVGVAFLWRSKWVLDSYLCFLFINTLPPPNL